MSEHSPDTPPVAETAPVRRRRPLLWVGAVLWVVCLVSLIGLWRQMHELRAMAQSAAKDDEPAGDGRPKQIKLVPQKDGSFLPQEVKPDDSPWDPAGIEDFSFQDTDGVTVTKQDLLGKPFVVSFIFTKCLGPCPKVTQQMRELQDRLKNYDFRLITLTVDPKRDSAEVLKEYAELNGADPHRWKFLTGQQAEIYGLIHRSFLVPVEETLDEDRKPGFEIIHSTYLMLVDSQGRVVGKYDAQKDAAIADLRRDLKKIAQRVNTAAEQTPEEPDADTPTATSRETEASTSPLSVSADEPAPRQLPKWAAALPAVNAALNGLAGVMLLIGYGFIRRKQVSAHAWTMIASFATSILFLACYLVYHYALHAYTGEPGKRFGHSGTLIGVTYLAILLTHVILAAAVPVLASMTLYRAWRRNWDGHRRIAKITFPIWVYVSVTGVIIYVMLYHWPGSAP